MRNKKVLTATALQEKICKEIGLVTVRDEDGCLILEGELSDWNDVVKAGEMAARHRGSRFVVNNVTLRDFVEPPMFVPSVKDKAYDGLTPDVLVIGGGVIGCAILRELAKFNVAAVLAEKENDVALHASSRNDGLVHAGIDLSSKTNKMRHTVDGNRMLREEAPLLGVKLEQRGQYLVFRKWLSVLLFPLMQRRAVKNGIGKLRLLSKAQFLKNEPYVDPKNIKAGVFMPTTANICPYGLTIALAENAVQNGQRVLLETAVIGMETSNGVVTCIKTNRGNIFPKVVVNAAGVFADVVAEMAGDKFFTIHPRRGTNVILDKQAQPSVTLTCVSNSDIIEKKRGHTKGGGIVRTVDDNILMGPDAVETPFREYEEVEPQSVESVFEKQKKCVPNVSKSSVITFFTGVRSPVYEEEFVITKGRKVNNLVHAAGMQSPALTACLSIAQEVGKLTCDILSVQGKEILPNQGFNPKRDAFVSVKDLSDEQRNELIKQNPNFGEIVCRCEEISKGEILDAMSRPIPALTMDAVKRRVRPGMGRCQGGFCGPPLLKIFAEKANLKETEVCKKGEGKVLVGDVKGGVL